MNQDSVGYLLRYADPIQVYSTLCRLDVPYRFRNKRRFPSKIANFSQPSYICINSEFVSVQLLKSYCLPFSSYTTEAIPLTKSSIKMLDDCIKGGLHQYHLTFKLRLIPPLISTLRKLHFTNSTCH